MKAVLKPWIDKPKPLKVTYEDSLVESLGYLTTEQQVKRLIEAGETLFNFRQNSNVAYVDSLVDDESDYYGDELDGLSALNELERYQEEKAYEASHNDDKASQRPPETKVDDKSSTDVGESNIH